MEKNALGRDCEAEASPLSARERGGEKAIPTASQVGRCHDLDFRGRLGRDDEDWDGTMKAFIASNQPRGGQREGDNNLLGARLSPTPISSSRSNYSMNVV